MSCAISDLFYKATFIKFNLFAKIKDLAVGAPYDGEDGSGIVYIYHGNSEGISEFPDQVNLEFV